MSKALCCGRKLNDDYLCSGCDRRVDFCLCMPLLEYQPMRREILKDFEMPPVKLGKTKPFNEEEYKRAIELLAKKIADKANKELRKTLKDNGLPEDIVYLDWTMNNNR